MYIRRTKTVNRNEAYYTYRIVESIRLGRKVKQQTLLNLGKDFSLARDYWPMLCARIEQLLQGPQTKQGEIFELSDELNQTLEAAAQRYSALFLQKHAQPVSAVDLSTDKAEALIQEAQTPDYHRVDINHVEAQNKVSVYSETDTETQEIRLYCHSEQKAKKEHAIRNRFHIRLEEALIHLHSGLSKKGCIKNYEKYYKKSAVYVKKISA